VKRAEATGGKFSFKSQMDAPLNNETAG